MATTPQHPARPRPDSAPPDLAELLPDIDGGMVELALSGALSQTAAAVVDHGSNGPKLRTGTASVAFTFEHIKGTNQVIADYVVKFTKPTAAGKAGEETEGQVVLYVGRGGALSIAQGTLRIQAAQTPITLPEQPGKAAG